MPRPALPEPPQHGGGAPVIEAQMYEETDFNEPAPPPPRATRAGDVSTRSSSSSFSSTRSLPPLPPRGQQGSETTCDVEEDELEDYGCVEAPPEISKRSSGLHKAAVPPPSEYELESDSGAENEYECDSYEDPPDLAGNAAARKQTCVNPNNFEPTEYAEIPADQEQPETYEQPSEQEAYEVPDENRNGGEYYEDPEEQKHRAQVPAAPPPRQQQPPPSPSRGPISPGVMKSPFGPAFGAGGHRPLVGNNTLKGALKSLRKVTRADEVFNNEEEYEEPPGVENLSVQDRVRTMGSGGGVAGRRPPPVHPVQAPPAGPRSSPAEDEGGLGWSAAGRRGSLNSSSSESGSGVFRTNTSHNTSATQNLDHYCWFFGNIDRKSAENKIMQAPSDGYYIIRNSRTDPQSPYALDVWYRDKVYHLNIRRCQDSMYALGKVKPEEETFESLVALVNHHHRQTITLQTGGRITGETVLTDSPPK